MPSSKPPSRTAKVPPSPEDLEARSFEAVVEPDKLNIPKTFVLVMGLLTPTDGASRVTLNYVYNPAENRDRWRRQGRTEMVLGRLARIRDEAGRLTANEVEGLLVQISKAVVEYVPRNSADASAAAFVKRMLELGDDGLFGAIRAQKEGSGNTPLACLARVAKLQAAASKGSAPVDPPASVGLGSLAGTNSASAAAVTA
ncbi:MAG: hypothetical protein J0M12_04190 [Deltaproteobacteria bacterium]|nr:hypothetical protein [Deltaproteobacteria bacterium]